MTTKKYDAAYIFAIKSEMRRLLNVQAAMDGFKPSQIVRILIRRYIEGKIIIKKKEAPPIIQKIRPINPAKKYVPKGEELIIRPIRKMITREAVMPPKDEMS